MRSLFITHTPYNTILAKTIARQKGINEYNIIYISNQKLHKAITENDYSDKVKIYKVKDRRDNPLSRFRYVSENRRIVREVKRISKAINYEKVYYFNDRKKEVQYIIDKMDSKHLNRVEDGLEAYVVARKNRKTTSLWSRVKQNIAYGSYSKNISHLGLYKKKKRLYCLYPQYADVRDDAELVEIDHNCFKMAVQEISPDENKSRGDYFSVVVLVPSSHTVTGKTEIQKYDRLISSQPGNVLVKLHPRETADDYITYWNSKNGCTVLPIRLPIEYAYSNMKNNVTIYGPLSTVIMTSKVYSSRRKYHLTKNCQSELANMLKKVGLIDHCHYSYCN